MAVRLPPLTSVRAFEAAARNCSMTHAANELCVTPAAVTHQVRALERWLGVKLFHRTGSALKLTSAGQTFFIGASRGIDSIASATEQVCAPAAAKQLAISAPPSFAAQWLVPRLSSFQSAYNTPISVSIRVPSPETHWRRDDIGIVSGTPTPDFLIRRPLFKYNIIAVCHPRLMQGPNAIRSINDLRHQQLLNDESLNGTDNVSWESWLARAGADSFDVSGGIRFNNAFAAYRFAADGHGVVLAKDLLVQNELRDGRLINPFNVSVPSLHTYDFVCSYEKAKSKPVSQFWDWLVSEARSDDLELAEGVCA
ncbi:LysR substrate-binding domain-containing protein [uncultured Paracoccus sp.]|uniref:LysR substrate-binding domain-containing protein n=1 Tax=uncultured Paracoccus sp. TaxID=189685 RepID=UPI0025F4AF1D|nr:LysR substrate-binding domain-containing protein [uncultured Paracoccus sp.]